MAKKEKEDGNYYNEGVGDLGLRRRLLMEELLQHLKPLYSGELQDSRGPSWRKV